MSKFMLAGISFWPDLWKPKSNTEKVLKYLEEAKNAGAEVVATPEGILDGYITRDLEKRKIAPKYKKTKGYRERLAKFRTGQINLAREIKKIYLPVIYEKVASLKFHVFLNTLDIREKEAVYNTTFYIGPDGKIRGKYDKVHADFEMVNKLGKGYTVFDTPYAKIGVLICADRQFPETVRCLALDGAQVIIINSYGMYGEGANERFIRQRAYENGVFVLFCHPGETVLVSPEGRIIAATCGWENILVRGIDPQEAIGRGIFGSATMAKTYKALSDLRKYQQHKLAIMRREQSK